MAGTDMVVLSDPVMAETVHGVGEGSVVTRTPDYATFDTVEYGICLFCCNVHPKLHSRAIPDFISAMLVTAWQCDIAQAHQKLLCCKPVVTGSDALIV